LFSSNVKSIILISFWGFLDLFNAVLYLNSTTTIFICFLIVCTAINCQLDNITNQINQFSLSANQHDLNVKSVFQLLKSYSKIISLIKSYNSFWQKFIFISIGIVLITNVVFLQQTLFAKMSTDERCILIVGFVGSAFSLFSLFAITKIPIKNKLLYKSFYKTNFCQKELYDLIKVMIFKYDLSI
jgi:hypothetical protein